MTRKTTLPLVLLLAGTLAACNAYTGPKETGGTLIGAGLGALAGSQIGSGTGKLAAVGVGTLLGAFLGNQAGASLDRADRLYASQSAQQGLETLPSGQTSEWRNPDSLNSGTFTPTSTYQAPDGLYCREYQQTVTVAGQHQSAYGTACRQPDGSWQIAGQ
jgi:surface antigen